MHHLLGSVFQDTEHLVDIGQVLAPGLGEFQRPVAALEQVLTEEFFQRLALVADRRLGYKQLLSGFGETQGRSGNPECTQGIEWRQLLHGFG